MAMAYEEKELELRDYLEVIIRRRFLIVMGTAACLLAALGLTFLKPQIYETEAVFRNASFPTNSEGVVTIDNPIKTVEVPEIFFSQPLLAPILGEYQKTRSNLLKNVTLENIQNSEFFKLKVKSSQPGKSQKMAAALIERFFDYGRPLLARKINLIKEEAVRKQNEVETLAPLVKKLESRLGVFEGASTDAILRASFVEKTFFEHKDRLEKAKAARMGLNNQLLFLKNFEIINPPEETQSGLKSKLLKNMLLAGLLGMVFFTYLAFFLDYWEKSSPDGK